jgi:hypothetical protein
MGVAIILAPLMLLFLASPLLYVIFFLFVAKVVSKQNTKQKRILAITATLLIFSIYPAQLYQEYSKFSESCETSRPPITNGPIKDIESIAFVTEGGDFINKPFVWHREMNLNLQKYEYAYLVNGKETMRNLCDWNSNKCEYGGEITSRYMFLVTAAKKNSNGVLQSNVSVVDRLTRQTFYEAHEYVFSGPVAAYHGAFLAKQNHRGYLSCGYLGKDINVWRPNDSNPSRLRYANTDSWVITTIFPSLKKN